MIKFGVSFFWFRFGSVLYKGGAGINGVKKIKVFGGETFGGGSGMMYCNVVLVRDCLVPELCPQ